MADDADLSERAPRLFAIVPETPDGEDGPVIGYGMRLASAESTARSGQDSRGPPTSRRRIATSWRNTNNSATSADSPRVICGSQPNIWTGAM